MTAIVILAIVAVMVGSALEKVMGLILMRVQDWTN